MKAGEATKRIHEATKAVMAEAMTELCRDIPNEFKLDQERWDGIWQYSRTYRHCDELTSTELELTFNVYNEGKIEFSAWALNHVLGGDADWKDGDTSTLDARALVAKVA